MIYGAEKGAWYWWWSELLQKKGGSFLLLKRQFSIHYPSYSVVSCSRHYWAVQSFPGLLYWHSIALAGNHRGLSGPPAQKNKLQNRLKNINILQKWFLTVLMEIYGQKRGLLGMLERFWIKLVWVASHFLQLMCFIRLSYALCHYWEPHRADVAFLGANTHKLISRWADGMGKSEFLAPSVILAHRVFASSWGRALLCQGTQRGHSMSKGPKLWAQNPRMAWVGQELRDHLVPCPCQKLSCRPSLNQTPLRSEAVVSVWFQWVMVNHIHQLRSGTSSGGEELIPALGKQRCGSVNTYPLPEKLWENPGHNTSNIKHYGVLIAQTEPTAKGTQFRDLRGEKKNSQLLFTHLQKHPKIQHSILTGERQIHQWALLSCNTTQGTFSLVTERFQVFNRKHSLRSVQLNSHASLHSEILTSEQCDESNSWTQLHRGGCPAVHSMIFQKCPKIKPLPTEI